MSRIDVNTVDGRVYVDLRDLIAWLASNDSPPFFIDALRELDVDE